MSTAASHVVVVLNWRGISDTLDCVASLAEGSPEVQVLVVDNGSFDGAIERVHQDFPAAATLQLERNLGFSGGMNRGIRHAIDELHATHVTILNNDTIIPRGVMASLVAAAGEQRVVSPEVRWRDDPERIWFAGGSLDARDGYPHHTPSDELTPCVGGIRRSALLAGCCLTAHTSVWEHVGLFDERFFLNFEDSEWSLRASARGVELIVACGVVIYHSVSASFRGAAATLGSYYFLRNGLLFTRLVGAGPLARVRFVRRFGLGGMRGMPARERRQALIVLAWAVGTYVIARFGEAPPRLQATIERWTTRSADQSAAASL